MRRKTTIEVIWDSEADEDPDGDDWGYLLRMGGINADEVKILSQEEVVE